MKKNKFKQILFVLALSIFAISCSSPLKISNDFDRSANFSSYHSFSVYSVKTTGSVSQLNADRIVNAIKENLIAKGLKYTESNGDLTINAITILKDKQSVTSSTNYYGYGGLYRPYGYYGGMGNTSVTTYNYKDGSLTIEMVDTKTTKMVWQGIGNKEIDKQSKDPDSEIKAAVTKILADFPPSK
jgi:PBP1b-binding outer membrane lipoprotein LpoB